MAKGMQLTVNTLATMIFLVVGVFMLLLFFAPVILENSPPAVSDFFYRLIGWAWG